MLEKKSIRRGEAPGSLFGTQGMALMLCLLLMTMLCLIGGAALGISGLNQKIVQNGTKQIQTFYLAEAGREMALACLKEQPLWRGEGFPASGSFEGELAIAGNRGVFKVTLSDCTADENGVLDILLPAGYVLLKSTGIWFDAEQSVSCTVHFAPSGVGAATFPQAAVVSSGSVTGPLIARNDLGSVDGTMVQASAALPEANTAGLRAMAEMAFPALDDDTWDDALSETTSFWLDPPANTRPRIVYVQGDLDVSGSRRLYGIILVAGTHMSLNEESEIIGVLYAPNATVSEIDNAGTTGRTAVTGLLVTGSGGVAVSGNSVSVQYCRDYVDAFNLAAGSDLDIDVVPGSWGTR